MQIDININSNQRYSCYHVMLRSGSEIITSALGFAVNNTEASLNAKSIADSYKKLLNDPDMPVNEEIEE